MPHPHPPVQLLVLCPSCGARLVTVLDTSRSEEIKVCEKCGFDSSADATLEESDGNPDAHN